MTRLEQLLGEDEGRGHVGLQPSSVPAQSRQLLVQETLIRTERLSRCCVS